MKYHYSICLALLILRLIDIPARLFIPDRSRLLMLFRNLGIYELNSFLFNFTCTISDLIFSIASGSFHYFFYTCLFPNDISSIENLIVHFHFTEFFHLLYLLDPVYLLYSSVSLPFKLNSILALQIATINLYPSQFTIPSWLPKRIGWLFSNIQILVFSFLNGYITCHIPSLNGFWFLSMCMVEQYSRLCYSLLLLYGSFLCHNKPQLLPIFKNGSTFISYLPYLLKSDYLGIYVSFAFLFDYLYMNFKQTEIVNINFIFWTSLLFIGFYIWDLKSGSLLSSRK